MKFSKIKAMRNWSLFNPKILHSISKLKSLRIGVEKRKYNDRFIHQIYLQKVSQVKQEIEESYKLNFSRSKYQSYQLHKPFAILTCLMFVVKHHKEFLDGIADFDYWILTELGIFVAMVSSINWLIQRFLKRFKRPKTDKLALLAMLKDEF